MVLQATATETKVWRSEPKGLIHPSAKDLATRRIASGFLMLLLFNAIYPFSPMSWISGAPTYKATSTASLLDAFLSPILILGAMAFQYRLAGITSLVTIELGTWVAIYKHSWYWTLVAGEMAVCLGSNLFLKGYGGSREMVRMGISVVLVGILWILGWACTSKKTKREAWEYVKLIWIGVAIKESRGCGGGRRGGCGM